MISFEIQTALFIINTDKIRHFEKIISCFSFLFATPVFDATIKLMNYIYYSISLSYPQYPHEI